MVVQLLELREEVQHLLLAALPLGDGKARRGRHQQVFCHGQVGEYLLTLGHQRDAHLRDAVGLAGFDAPPLEGDRALGHARVVDAVEAGDGAQKRRLARTVGAEDADDLALARRQGYALHRGYGALVDDLQLVDCQQRLAHLRGPAVGRCLKGHRRK